MKDEIKAASEVRVGREKIKKQKHMLDDLVTERAKKREKERYPMTEEKLKSIEMEISQLNKLMLQEASPTKYASSGIVSPFQENVYAKAHKDKVK